MTSGCCTSRPRDSWDDWSVPELAARRRGGRSCCNSTGDDRSVGDAPAWIYGVRPRRSRRTIPAAVAAPAVAVPGSAVLGQPQDRRAPPEPAAHTYGVGAIVDLPNLSRDGHGPGRLDRRAPGSGRRAAPARGRPAGARAAGRAAAARRRGDSTDANADPFDDSATSACRSRRSRAGCSARAATCWPADPSGLFELSTRPVPPGPRRYVHRICSRLARRQAAHACVPARFLVACEHGHLDDFPWVEFVHATGPRASATDRGSTHADAASGSSADIQVRVRHVRARAGPSQRGVRRRAAAGRSCRLPGPPSAPAAVRRGDVQGQQRRSCSAHRTAGSRYAVGACRSRRTADRRRGQLVEANWADPGASRAVAAR